QRLVPFDFAELAFPALSDAQERLAQPRRRIVLHDPRRTLRADHAPVDRMIGIAVDEAYAAVFQVDPDPAPARAHVARRGLDFVASRFVELEVLVSHMRACCRFPLRCYRTV